MLTEALALLGTTQEYFTKYTAAELAGSTLRSINIQVRPSQAMISEASSITIDIACEFSLDVAFPEDSLYSSTGTYSAEEVSC
mmetsp:Transcript_30594/g.46948  ORF Transcript_30594/g.46948 Transcript_30594/m.46948 type:complete len:83 (-) Transcript_30594:14453-14701(-)